MNIIYQKIIAMVLFCLNYVLQMDIKDNDAEKQKFNINKFHDTHVRPKVTTPAATMTDKQTQ